MLTCLHPGQPVDRSAAFYRKDHLMAKLASVHMPTHAQRRYAAGEKINDLDRTNRHNANPKAVMTEGVEPC